jgi:hypothetical protein
MKKLIMLLFMIPAMGFSQSNILSLTFSGNDLAPGVRYDRKLSVEDKQLQLGIYLQTSAGQYRDPEIGKVNHIKLSAGITKYNLHDKDFMNTLSIGLSAHYYNQVKEGAGPLRAIATFPISCEVGVGIIIDRFAGGITVDPIKNDFILNLGIRF